MPTKIKLKVFAARDLPIMDTPNQTTDAYVEVKLSDIYSEKTNIAHKTLNPHWDHEFTIEVSHDGDILKHPLELKVWDRDTISSDDVIGGVLLDLSNLLLNETSEILGWFPIYDTMRGARGELKISVSLIFFGKTTGIGMDSTASVMFAYGPIAPPGMCITHILGFVEELLVDDDPEYNWKDTFRPPRASNESRQYLLYKLSAKLRREIGTKVIGLGGNAVIGFKKHIDYENEGSIIVRGYGTAVTLKKLRPPLLNNTHSLSVGSYSSTHNPGSPGSVEDDPMAMSTQRLSPVTEGILESSLSGSHPELPSYSALNTPSIPIQTANILVYPLAPANYGRDKISQLRKESSNFSVLKMHAGDIQFLTISQFPPPTVVRIAGIVTAHSIKLIPKGLNEDKARAARDKWWSELRTEMKNHARFLSCQYVLGYRETTTFYDDMIILTSSGVGETFTSSAVLQPNSGLSDSSSPVNTAGSSNIAANMNNTTAMTANMDIPNHFEAGNVMGSYSVGGNPLSATVEIPSTSHASFHPIPIASSPLMRSAMSSSAPHGTFLLSQFTTPNFGLQPSGYGLQGSGYIPPVVEISPEQKQFQHNACGCCHVPYKVEKAPYKLKLVPCRLCGAKTVPEILLASIDPPPGIAIIGQGQMIEAYAARPKKKAGSESSAAQTSEAIPFLEYDLYKQLMNKLKVLGMNACFKMSTRIVVGDNIILGHTQATTVCLAALPRPDPLKLRITTEMSAKSKLLVQQLVKMSLENHKALNDIEYFPDPHLPFLWSRSSLSSLLSHKPGSLLSSSMEDPASGYPGGSMGTQTNAPGGHGPSHSPTDPHHLDDVIDDPNLFIEDIQRPEGEVLGPPTPSYLIEVENDLDEDLMALIASDPTYPTDFRLANTQILPGTKIVNWHNMQLITVVRTLEWSATKNPSQLTKLLASVFQSLYAHLSFRMHLIRPCAVVGIKIDIQIPNNDEVQLSFTGMALHSSAPFKTLVAPPPTSNNTSNPTLTASIASTPLKKKAKRLGKDDENITTSAETQVVEMVTDDSKKPKKRNKFKKGASSELITKDSLSSTPKDTPELSREEKREKEDKKEGKEDKKEKTSSSSASSNSVDTKVKEDRKDDRKEDRKEEKSSDKTEGGRPRGNSIQSSKNANSSVNPKESTKSSSGEIPTTPTKNSPQQVYQPPTTPRGNSKPDVLSTTDLEDIISSSLNPKESSSRTSQESKTNDPSKNNDSSSSKSSHVFVPRPLNLTYSPQAFLTPDVPHVEITPLSYIPGSQLDKFIGTIHLSFIKESFSIRELGGMSVFTQNLVLEAQRVARSHVLALGANVLASYNMEMTQKYKAGKNQGYCLLTITGDAILANSTPHSAKGYKKLAQALTKLSHLATTTTKSK